MPSINISITNGLNDGTWRNSVIFNNTHPEATLWTYRTADGYRNRGFMRFTGVNIPQGADIYEALITVRCVYDTITGAPIYPGSGDAFQVRAWDIDNATAILDGDDADAMLSDLTTAVLNTDPEWSSGFNYTIDVKDILQEIVNRGGWDSGNAVVFIFQTTAMGSGTGRYVASYEAGIAPSLGVQFDSWDSTSAVTARATVRAAASVTEASPLLDDLIAYYPLNESSGDAIDIHSGGYDLTDVNDPASATGIISTSRDLEDYPASYFTRSSEAAFQIGMTSFTVSFWVYLNYNGGNQFLVSKWVDSGGAEYAIYYTGSQFKITASIGGYDSIGSYSATAATPNPASLGTWYHVVAWYDITGPNHLNISVNNATPSTGFYYNYGVYMGSSPFRIGGDGSGYNLADARIDEVGFWKRVLTSDERTDLYNAGSGLAYPFGGIVRKAESFLTASAEVTTTSVLASRVAGSSMEASATVTCGVKKRVFVSASLTATARITANPNDSLHQGLISYWPCNEASGNLLDAFGSNALTDTNTVAAGTGKIAGGRDFEYSNSEYFTRASNSSLQTGDIGFTFSLWVNLESKPVGLNQALVGKWAGSSHEYLLYYNETSNRFIWIVTSTGLDASATLIYLGSAGPSLATWYNIVVWHDPTANQIGGTINNGTAVTGSHSTGVYAGTSVFRVGATGDTNAFLDGIVDEVGFWKRVLTADERARLYNAGTGKAFPFAYEYGRASLTTSTTVTTSVSVIKPLSASLSASASITPVVTRSFFRRLASLTASASLTAAARAGQSASLIGTTTVSASAVQGYRASASLQGSVLTSITAQKEWQRSAALSGSASVAAVGIQSHLTSCSLTASTSGSVTTTVAYLASASVTGTASTVASARRIMPVSGSLLASASTSASNNVRKRLTASLVASASGSVTSIRSLYGSSSMTTTTMVTVANKLIKPVSASLTGTASIEATNKKRISISVDLSATASTDVATRRDLLLKKSLFASASVESSASRLRPLSASITASGRLHASSRRDLIASSSLSATVGLTASQKVYRPVSAFLSGTASVEASSTRRIPVSSSITGSASIQAHPIQSFVASSSLTGSASVSGRGLQDYLGSSHLIGSASISANYWQHVGEGLLEYLLTCEPVTELVGDRIYPGQWPMEEGSPAIVYTFGVSRHGTTLRRPDGVAEADLTISIFARTVEKRDSIAAAVHKSLVDYSGRWGAVSIRQVYADGEGDGAEVEGHFFTQLDYVVVYDESRPLNVSSIFSGDASLEDSLIEFFSDLAPTYPQWIEREEVSQNIIRYRRVTVERGVVLGGETGHDRITIEVSVRSRRLNEVYRLANTLRNRLDGYVGTIETTGVLVAKILSETDAMTRFADGSENPYHEVVQSYIFGVQRNYVAID